ncbi:MAG: ABC transporter ATP-binding protein [Phycisphaerae bacterium]|nr:ABC transporter ATP-binding protein [Phycisphaerae bacterium]
MSESAIEIRDLHFRYGRKQVLTGVNLEVPTGSIFGFLGRNGAGKTTTIKTLLGLLRPGAGTCKVLGADPQEDPMTVRRGVGYMAEDQRMYGWMTVDQITRWTASFYPRWDRPFTDKLLEVLELDRKAKVKSLSKGQNSRLALLLALGHRPKVVILDDPTLGLDPIARKEFLRHVIGLLQSHGVTVFFSSHLLYEIEPVADYVAILDQGRIVKAGKTVELRESVRRFVLAEADGFDPGQITGVLDVAREGDCLAVTVEDCDPAKREAFRNGKARFIREVPLNLDEIFEAYVIGNRGKERTL